MINWLDANQHPIWSATTSLGFSCHCLSVRHSACHCICLFGHLAIWKLGTVSAGRGVVGGRERRVYFQQRQAETDTNGLIRRHTSADRCQPGVVACWWSPHQPMHALLYKKSVGCICTQSLTICKHVNLVYFRRPRNQCVYCRLNPRKTQISCTIPPHTCPPT